MSALLHLGLLGHKGRLGSKIVELLADQPDIICSPIPRDSTYEQDFGVIIDVSKPDGTAHMLQSLLDLNRKTPVIIGVTGDLPFGLIQKYSKVAPTALVSNFSFGVPQFIQFLEVIKNEQNWNISMVERHHVHKIDKPSGTAKTLASFFKTPIDIESVREGEIIGEHDLTLENEFEKLVISHTAKDRSIFAAGAIRYAKWLPHQAPGLYKGMEKQKLHFSKYEGCGNDFVFVSNQAFASKEAKIPFIQTVCQTGTGVGADGVIFVEKRDKAAYWEYYNRDGSLVAMCGNGARCVAWYSINQGWNCTELINGFDIRQKFFLEDGVVCVEMPKAIVDQPPEGVLKLAENDALKNYVFEGLFRVGVEHSVFSVPDGVDIDNLSPNPIGEAVRKVVDVNTNIYQRKDGLITIRTYERGVYDETLACGSGCCSVAYHIWTKEGEGKEHKYFLKVRSGLKILVRIAADGTIFLSGPTRKVFDGTLEDW